MFTFCLTSVSVLVLSTAVHRKLPFQYEFGSHRQLALVYNTQKHSVLIQC